MRKDGTNRWWLSYNADNHSFRISFEMLYSLFSISTTIQFLICLHAVITMRSEEDNK